MALRRDDKYRFSLQWSADTEERIQAGDLLERLGNKKSDVVVAAITEFVLQHPELMSSDAEIKITCHQTQSKEQLLEMVRSMAKAAVEELLAGKVVTIPEAGQARNTETGPSEQEIDAMLAGLELFSQ